MHVYPQRLVLQGVQSELFNLVSNNSTPCRWRQWLRVPLEHAAARGNIDLVSRLLKAGADGSAGVTGCNGRTLLDAAAVGGSADVVSALLRAGCGPDAKMVSSSPKREGRLLLHLAVEYGHLDGTLAFLAAGVDTSVRSMESDSRSALDIAIESGHLAVVGALIHHGGKDDVNACSERGTIPLHRAAHSTIPA
ncbi:unnamed protein product [Ectocarpus sp. CCAP 1310/34]|nr:unnamed protein product [Ectocarpus sp. CCAP 1310/34]